jgi:hypothetical protein
LTGVLTSFAGVNWSELVRYAKFQAEFQRHGTNMIGFLLWIVVFLLCWPLALLALLLYPIVWLLLLPFRILGIAVDGVFSLLRAIVFLPARVLGERTR